MKSIIIIISIIMLQAFFLKMETRLRKQLKRKYNVLLQNLLPYIGYLWQALPVPCFSLQVTYISTDIFQMLVALIPSLTPPTSVANELAWKQLLAGNMTYDSRQMHFNTDE